MKFCSECGHSLAGAPNPKFCPECGHSLRSSSISASLDPCPQSPPGPPPHVATTSSTPSSSSTTRTSPSIPSPASSSTPPPARRLTQRTLPLHGVSVTRKSDGAHIILQAGTEKRPFKCPFLHCDKTFRRSNDLTNHKKAMHQPTDPLRVHTQASFSQLNIQHFAPAYSRLTPMFPSTVSMFVCPWVPKVQKALSAAASAVAVQYAMLTSTYPSCVGLFAYCIPMQMPNRCSVRREREPKHKKALFGRRLNHGSKVRKCALLCTRKKAIDKYAEYLSEPKHRRPSNIAQAIASWLGTERVNVTKWWHKRERYWAAWRSMATTRNKAKQAIPYSRRRYLPRVKLGRYEQADAQLHREFIRHREGGHKVSGLWLRLRMRKIVQRLYPNAVMKATMGWLYRLFIAVFVAVAVFIAVRSYVCWCTGGAHVMVLWYEGAQLTKPQYRTDYQRSSVGMHGYGSASSVVSRLVL